MKALVDKMEKTVTEEGKKTVFISHGDCLKDAELVADMVWERFGTEDIHINYVGPVIGAIPAPVPWPCSIWAPSAKPLS